MTRRTFLKLVGATSAALYVGAVKLKILTPCPLCEEGFPHWPPSSPDGWACRWLEVNRRFPCPASWRLDKR